MMIKYDKGAAVRISTVLGTFYHIACRRVLQMGIFTDVSNHIFRRT